MELDSQTVLLLGIAGISVYLIYENTNKPKRGRPPAQHQPQSVPVTPQAQPAQPAQQNQSNDLY